MTMPGGENGERLLPTRTLLVVDDEDQVRGALARLLAAEDWKVLQADSGEEALRILAETPVHAMITDHNMPGMSGIELLKRVRDLHPDVLRIMLTGDVDPNTFQRSIEEGEVYRFIRKPWDNANVRAIMRLALEVVLLEEEKRQLLDVVRRQRAALESIDGKPDPEAELLLAEDALHKR